MKYFGSFLSGDPSFGAGKQATNVPSFYNPWLEKYGNSVSALRGRSKFEETTSISFKPQSSSDIALISFAQLGCLRLNAKRGIIVLISTDTQFILCEATKTLSLARGARHMAGDELWFGSGSLKRQDGMSEQSLNPENYTATNADGSTFTCPAFVVNDLTTDAHYSSRGFVRGGIRFYCGVPIVAENGQAIGAYTVTDDKPRDGVTGEELQFMYDMSRVVADHLLVIRQASARQRGEFLVRTLASFIEGRTEYASHSAEEKEVEQAPVTAASTEEKPSTKVVGIDMSYLASVKPQSRNHTQSSKTDAPRSEDHTGQIQVLRQDSQASTDSESMHDAPHVATADAEAMASAAMTHNASQPQVFQRAADLLRRATTADGVLFFDAVAANALAAAKSGVSADAHAHYTTSKGVQRSDSSSDRGHPERPHLDKHGSHNSDISIASQSSGRTHSDSDSMGSFHRASRSKQSGILGISVKPGSVPSTSRAALDNLQIREVDLRRTTKRYPQGRVFLFNEAGYLTSSDTDGSDSTKRKALASGSDMQPDQTADEKRQGERRIANALHKAVPTARNMVFLPMWDFAMDRWHAGAFIWSNKEELLLTVQDDLSYIKAFSFAVMSEVARLNSIESDLAKTTFLANISHELRSPLHGILGSIEFIQETVLDAFQSSLITSIETCGKTLLDTVDHVLDHSKINQLSPKGPSAIGFADASSGVPNSNVHSLTEKFDLGVMVEEVVEAVYSGQTFRNRKLSPSTDESPTRDAQDNESDADQIRALSSGSGGKTFITLSIEHGVDWQVFSQPGAIRRILMNLVGNSLKYTTHGGINVTLETRKVKQHSERNDQVLKLWLKVEDTGKGISEDFLKHHLFTPFRQENYFSSGTGLGLSIVQQVVASLDGKIDVRSKLGEGTEVKVALDLVRVPELAKTNILETLNDVRRQTKGQVICIPSPSLQIPQHYARDDQRLQSPGKAFAAIAEEWFDMRIEQSENMQDVTADYLVYAEPPPVDFLIQRHGQDSPNATVPVILICQNAQESAWLIANGLNKLTDNGRVVEIMSQPYVLLSQCRPYLLTVAQMRTSKIRQSYSSLSALTSRRSRPTKSTSTSGKSH